jgi:hypothetical protein
MVNGFIVKLVHRCLNDNIMSSEHSNLYSSTEKLDKDFNKKEFNKVDINHLLAKVRVEEKKTKKDNLIFLGVISTVIVVTGIIVA